MVAMPATSLTLGCFTLVVALVAGERLVELAVSKRGERWSLARGGVEHGTSHYLPMVACHVGLLAGSLAEVWIARRPFLPVVAAAMLGLTGAAQALRWWCVRSLGRHWNTRVIVVPGSTLVRRGPYRWISHPNYVAVVIEGVTLPLIHTAWLTALCFTLVNAGILAVRIRVENAALASATARETRSTPEARTATTDPPTARP